jgi:hypothetical protein
MKAIRYNFGEVDVETENDRLNPDFLAAAADPDGRSVRERQDRVRRSTP